MRWALWVSIPVAEEMKRSKIFVSTPSTSFHGSQLKGPNVAEPDISDGLHEWRRFLWL